MRHVFLVAAWLAVAAVPLVAGDREWWDDVRAFREGGPGTKAVVARRLGECRDPAALTEILSILDDADYRTRGPLRKAVRAIAPLADGKVVLDVIVGAPPRARDTALLLLGDEVARGRTELVTERLRTEAAPAMGELLAKTGRGDAVDLLLAVLADADSAVRFRVIGPLGSCVRHAARIVPQLNKAMVRAGDAEAQELLWAGVRLPGPESRKWLVNVALGKSLPHLVAVIDPAYRADVLLDLVNLLPRTHPILVRLVGKDLGGFVADWRRHVGRISPPENPRRGSAPPPPAKDPNADPNADAVPDAGRMFYGVPLPKGDFVFILDASASMNREVDGVKLIDQVTRRVRELLDQMRNGQKFNIVFFNSMAKIHQRRLVARSDESARIAGRFLNKIRAEGPTNLEAGLRAALRDPDVVEIILLSDGLPNRGAVRSSSRVRFMLGMRRVRIHTVGNRDSARLMKDIARDTGGNYGEL